MKRWGPLVLVLAFGPSGCQGTTAEVSLTATLQPPAQAAVPAPSFDKNRAFADLKKQVEFGPRTPGSAGHRACRDYLESTLKSLADQVTRQDFSRQFDGKTLPMTNIIAKWKGRSDGKAALLCAHWDTRPTADQESDPKARARPIAGANDGASGVAVLLELARRFHAQPPPAPVMMVLFDGEDWGPGLDRMFLGSRYFANNLPRDVPQQGILLDMVGDRDLVIPQEGYSMVNARQVVTEVYAVAKRLGLERHFPPQPGGPIEDDHVRLLEKGLEVIDLIDFDYGPNHSWWHTREDTPDKCSPDSLKAVGDVVWSWVDGRGK